MGVNCRTYRSVAITIPRRVWRLQMRYRSIGAPTTLPHSVQEPS